MAFRPAPKAKSKPAEGGPMCVSLYSIQNLNTPTFLITYLINVCFSVEMDIKRTIPICEVQHGTRTGTAIRKFYMLKDKIDIPLKIIRLCPMDSGAAGKHISEAAAIALFIEQIVQRFKFSAVFGDG